MYAQRRRFKPLRSYRRSSHVQQCSFKRIFVTIVTALVLWYMLSWFWVLTHTVKDVSSNETNQRDDRHYHQEPVQNIMYKHQGISHNDETSTTTIDNFDFHVTLWQPNKFHFELVPTFVELFVSMIGKIKTINSNNNNNSNNKYESIVIDYIAYNNHKYLSLNETSMRYYMLSDFFELLNQQYCVTFGFKCQLNILYNKGRFCYEIDSNLREYINKNTNIFLILTYYFDRNYPIYWRSMIQFEIYKIMKNRNTNIINDVMINQQNLFQIWIVHHDTPIYVGNPKTIYQTYNKHKFLEYIAKYDIIKFIALTPMQKRYLEANFNWQAAIIQALQSSESSKSSQSDTQLIKSNLQSKNIFYQFYASSMFQSQSLNQFAAKHGNLRIPHFLSPVGQRKNSINDILQSQLNIENRLQSSSNNNVVKNRTRILIQGQKLNWKRDWNFLVSLFKDGRFLNEQLYNDFEFITLGQFELIDDLKQYTKPHQSENGMLPNFITDFTDTTDIEYLYLINQATFYLTLLGVKDSTVYNDNTNNNNNNNYKSKSIVKPMDTYTKGLKFSSTFLYSWAMGKCLMVERDLYRIWTNERSNRIRELFEDSWFMYNDVDSMVDMLLGIRRNPEMIDECLMFAKMLRDEMLHANQQTFVDIVNANSF